MVFTSPSAAVRLPAADLERARAWYRGRLGLDPAEERDGGLRYVLGGTEFCLFESSGASTGAFTQMAITVEDLDSTMRALRARGVEFERFEGLTDEDAVAAIDGNYPSKGTGERAAWFRDSEGNLVGLGQPVG
jgi:catechol 2,3-dioxygenase-like lactoylglutathione lyase family enzyme